MAATENRLEGIMAKKKDSKYLFGERTKEWLKIKKKHTIDAIITGFTEPKGSRKKIGALVLGKYIGGKLTYIGHAGGGLNE